MTSRRSIVFTVITLALCACHVGPQIEQMTAPISPEGADVLITVKHEVKPKSREYRGELLETNSDGLLIGLNSESSPSPRITLIPWNIIYIVKAPELQGISSKTSFNRKSHDSAVESFKRVSRYPQGLSSELREKLLSSFNQTAVDVLEKEMKL